MKLVCASVWMNSLGTVNPKLDPRSRTPPLSLIHRLGVIQDQQANASREVCAWQKAIIVSSHSQFPYQLLPSIYTFKMDHKDDVEDKPQPALSEDVESQEKVEAPNASMSYTGKGTAEDRALLWKQDLRIIPLCAGIYLLCYLDRRQDSALEADVWISLTSWTVISATPKSSIKTLETMYILPHLCSPPIH